MVAQMMERDKRLKIIMFAVEVAVMLVLVSLAWGKLDGRVTLLELQTCEKVLQLEAQSRAKLDSAVFSEYRGGVDARLARIEQQNQQTNAKLDRMIEMIMEQKKQ